MIFNHLVERIKEVYANITPLEQEAATELSTVLMYNRETCALLGVDYTSMPEQDAQKVILYAAECIANRVK